MPRIGFLRHLRVDPPDEATAQQYFLHFRDSELYEQPEAFSRLDGASLFGDPRPFHLEIGCGTGDYLCWLARQQTSECFVGVDRSRKALYKAIETAACMDLDNIRFIRSDMRLLYPLIDPESLAAIYLHFPEPPLRTRHRKRTLFTPEFLDQADRMLVVGGHLSVVTDAKAFFMEMLELTEQNPHFEKMHPERFMTGFDTEVKSRFQRLWEGYGEVIFRFEVRKKTDLEPPSRQGRQGRLWGKGDASRP